MTDKANKTTVAQALHRKANKPEVEANLTKKVDYDDLQRILDNKVDVASFQNIVRTVEYKADKHDILQYNLTLQQHAQQQTTLDQNATNIDRAELERLTNQLKSSNEEATARMTAQESQISELRNFADTSISQLTNQLNMQLQQREDLEAILHSKADSEQMQQLIKELKGEVLSQLKLTKKELKKKTSKKKEEV